VQQVTFHVSGGLPARKVHEWTTNLRGPGSGSDAGRVHRGYLGRSAGPYAIVGQNSWRDYTVSARVVLPASDAGSPAPGACLIARFQGFSRSTLSHFRGYELKVDSSGIWQIVANGPAPVTLASGSVIARDAYAMSLTTSGTSITARTAPPGWAASATTRCATRALRSANPVLPSPRGEPMPSPAPAQVALESADE
jgi:hypothetical protein